MTAMGFCGTDLGHFTVEGKLSELHRKYDFGLVSDLHAISHDIHQAVEAMVRSLAQASETHFRPANTCKFPSMLSNDALVKTYPSRGYAAGESVH